MNMSEDFKNLPDDIIISTMTIICKINVNFNVDNIAKYINLSNENIITVKYGEFSNTNRTIINKKKNNRKKSTRGLKNFYNQVTLVINMNQNNLIQTTKKKKRKIINIKLFKNGSIQITGCNNIENVIKTITNLFDELKKVYAVLDDNNNIIDKPFVSDLSLLDIKNIYDFKIVMINSNFNIQFQIDRDKLFYCLINDGYECSYDPIIHACVDIRFSYSDSKKISIFIFESGAVIITGSTNCDHIVTAYNHINKYLLTHYSQIVKKDLLKINEILKYLQ